MADDLALRGADSDIQAVADALADRLAGTDELSAWALVEASDGFSFMILLIRDESAPPRILFGAHRSGERSLPDRVVLEDLDRETVMRGVATALGRAVQRGEAAPGSRLRLVSTGTPSDGPRDVGPDRAHAGAVDARPSPTGVS